MGKGITTSSELKAILESVLRGMAVVSTKGMSGLTPDDEMTVILKDTFQEEGGTVDRIYAAVRRGVQAQLHLDISRTTLINAMKYNKIKYVQNMPTRIEPVLHQHFCRSQVSSDNRRCSFIVGNIDTVIFHALGTHVRMVLSPLRSVYDYPIDRSEGTVQSQY